jgi:hypothetical protein
MMQNISVNDNKFAIRVHKTDLFVDGKKIKITKIVDFFEGNQAGQ